MSRKPCARSCAPPIRALLEHVVRHGDRPRKAHVPRGRAEPALRHVRDHGGDEGIAEPAGDALGQDLDARIVLAERHVRPVLLRPPIGTMIVDFPARTRSRTSVHVSSSRKTVSGASAPARGVPASARHSTVAVAADRMVFARARWRDFRHGTAAMINLIRRSRDLSIAGAKEWTKKPLSSLGSNHVLFGGMMAPASRRP